MSFNPAVTYHGDQYYNQAITGAANTLSEAAMKALSKYEEDKRQRQFNTGVLDTLKQDPRTANYIPVEALSRWDSMNGDKQAGVLAGVARRQAGEAADLQRRNVESEINARQQELLLRQRSANLAESEANWQPTEQDLQRARWTGNELLPTGRGRFAAQSYDDQPGTGGVGGGVKVEPYIDPNTQKPVPGYGIVHGKGNQFQIVYTGNLSSGGQAVETDPETGVPFVRGPKGEIKPLNIGQASAGQLNKLTRENQPAAKPTATPTIPAGGGKALDAGTAQAILQQAGGDKDKAREMAKQLGYVF